MATIEGYALVYIEGDISHKLALLNMAVKWLLAFGFWLFAVKDLSRTTSRGRGRRAAEKKVNCS